MPTFTRSIDRRTCLTSAGRTLAALLVLPLDAFTARHAQGQTPAPAPAPAPAPGGPVSRLVTVGGLSLHYLEWTRGADDRRPALVLLHPGMLNAHAWDRFGSAMAPYFRVVAPDARGHGESAWAPPYETATLLTDLHGLIEALELRDLTLCGNSMGGTLAIGYAAAHPEAVRRVISVDTGAMPPAAPGSTPAPRPPLPPPLPEGPFASRDEAAARLDPVMGRAFIDAMTTTNLTRAEDGRWRWKHDYAGMQAGLPAAMADPGRWTRWQALTCPALLIRGDRSPALSAEAAERMVAGRANATLETIAGAGHFVALDQPEAFERVVRRWLGVDSLL